MTRHECFLELDELIAAGWGDIPWNKIPANWRDGTPQELRQAREHQEAMERNFARKRRMGQAQKRDTILRKEA